MPSPLQPWLSGNRISMTSVIAVVQMSYALEQLQLARRWHVSALHVHRTVRPADIDGGALAQELKIDPPAG